MESLPHWNLQSIYPGIDSLEFEKDLKSLDALVAAIRADLDNDTGRKADFPLWLVTLLDDYQKALDYIGDNLVSQERIYSVVERGNLAGRCLKEVRAPVSEDL